MTNTDPFDIDWTLLFEFFIEDASRRLSWEKHPYDCARQIHQEILGNVPPYRRDKITTILSVFSCDIS